MVSNLTGVAAPTLRAWERRYGVPRPARTASAYRLYDEDDVAEVARMRDLCASGLPAAQAAAAIAREREQRAEQRGDVGGFGGAIDRLVRATARMDAEALDLELSRAAEVGPATTFFEGIVAPTLVRIGDLWQSGELSIAHEHFASERVGAFVRSRLRLVQPSGDARLVLLACFADEEHSLGMLGVALRFASWGFRTIELGARTPPAAVADAVNATRPHLVGLSLTSLPDGARTLVRAYAKAMGGVPWIVGGSAAQTVASAVMSAGGAVAERPIGELHHVVRGALARGRHET